MLTPHHVTIDTLRRHISLFYLFPSPTTLYQAFSLSTITIYPSTASQRCHFYPSHITPNSQPRHPLHQYRVIPSRIHPHTSHSSPHKNVPSTTSTLGLKITQVAFLSIDLPIEIRTWRHHVPNPPLESKCGGTKSAPVYRLLLLLLSSLLVFGRKS